MGTIFNMNKSWNYHTCPETLDDILVCPTAFQNCKKQLLVIGKNHRASSLPAETKNCNQCCKPACKSLKTHDRGSCWASLTTKHSCGSFEGKSVVVSRRSMWPHLKLGIFEALHTVRHTGSHGDADVWKMAAASFPSGVLQHLSSELHLKENGMKKSKINPQSCGVSDKPSKLKYCLGTY